MTSMESYGAVMATTIGDAREELRSSFSSIGGEMSSNVGGHHPICSIFYQIFLLGNFRRFAAFVWNPISPIGLTEYN